MMDNTVFYSRVFSGIGFTAGIQRETLVSLNFDLYPRAVNNVSCDLWDELQKQLAEYFDGKRKGFDIPISYHGTAFQERVWKALMEIPYGEMRTYGEIAEMIGNPKASRAVGMACHRNPIGIIIPCHRVIGKDGSLTGFAGGLDLKEKLLVLEKKYK